MIDYLRPLILDNNKIEAWYRYNTFLYSSSEYINTLPKHIQDCVAEREKLPDLSPFVYKMRKKVISLMPIHIMTHIAKKEKHFST